MSPAVIATRSVPAALAATVVAATAKAAINARTERVVHARHERTKTGGIKFIGWPCLSVAPGREARLLGSLLAICGPTRSIHRRSPKEAGGWALVQLLGAVFLVAVVLAHVAEAFTMSLPAPIAG